MPSTKRTSGARSISFACSSRTWWCLCSCARSRGVVAPDLERALRDRRGAVDAGDAADRSGLVRPRRSRSTASDASPAAIAEARAGRLSRARSFRNLPPALREKYFVPHDDKWSVDPELQRRVSYDVVNLVDEDQVPRHASAPIIVCRNVFIYFSESIRARRRPCSSARCRRPATCVSARRNRCCVGRSAFDLQEIGGAFVYVKDAPPSGHHPDPRLSGVERV